MWSAQDVIEFADMREDFCPVDSFVEVLSYAEQDTESGPILPKAINTKLNQSDDKDPTTIEIITTNQEAQNFVNLLCLACRKCALGKWEAIGNQSEITNTVRKEAS